MRAPGVLRRTVQHLAAYRMAFLVAPVMVVVALPLMAFERSAIDAFAASRARERSGAVELAGVAIEEQIDTARQRLAGFAASDDATAGLRRRAAQPLVTGLIDLVSATKAQYAYAIDADGARFANVAGAGDGPVVDVRVDVRDGERALGSLVIGLPTERLIEAAARLVGTLGRELVLVDAAGRALASSDPARQSLSLVRFDGDDPRVAMTALPRFDWQLYAVDQSAAFAPERALDEQLRVATVRGLWVAAAVAVFLLLANAWTRGRRVIDSRPLNDRLTGLPNRSLLVDRLRQLALLGGRNQRPSTLLIFDLDDFRSLNETYGFRSGDRVLQEVASRLRGRLRASDTVARIGPDDFAVLLPGADATSATRVARDLLRIVNRPSKIDDVELVASATAGMVCLPQHGTDVETLIRRAELAVQFAKQSADGFAVFTEDQERSGRWSNAREEVRRALEHRELSVHYQPQVDLKSGRIVGVEALVRWEHPERGLLSAGEFLPIVERSGLTPLLTEAVLDTALREAGGWSQWGVPLRIAVNLSSRNLVQRSLPEVVAQKLRAHGVQAGRLTLELSEAALMEDLPRSIEVLGRLRALGVRLAIDDFGSGASSLKQLSNLAVHEIKIDPSFIVDLAHDNRAVAVLRTISDLAHGLGMAVVAEAIPDRVVCGRVVQVGCDIGQGYYFTAPLPGSQLAGWFSEATRPAERAAPFGADFLERARAARSLPA